LFNTFAAAKNLEPKPIPVPKAVPEVVTKSEPVSEPVTEPVCNNIRFPPVQGSNNLIPCKWRDCNMSFTAYGKLSDHLKVNSSICLSALFDLINKLSISIKIKNIKVILSEKASA
jgi:hypothetical protein